MKKLALALVAATTFAGAASADLTTGFYLGAGIGANSLTAPFAYNGVSGNLGRNRFEGSIYGGYGYVSGCTYVGGELGYTFTGGKASFTGNNAGVITTASIERRNVINAAFIIGQKFSPSTMIYARLGMNSTQYRTVLSVPGVATVNTKKRKVSFAPGVGLEGAVTKNVRVRLQYVYDVGNSLPNTGKVKSQATTLGVAYKF
jgi:opacity protein-like surface antigen